MPPVTPSQWRTTRLADASGPACPQVPPAAVPRDDALLLHPRARIRQLERLLPVLANQSEDCLYVNLYVPVNGNVYLYHLDLFCFVLKFQITDVCLEMGPVNGDRCASYQMVPQTVISYHACRTHFLCVSLRGCLCVRMMYNLVFVSFFPV